MRKKKSGVKGDVKNKVGFDRKGKRVKEVLDRGKERVETIHAQISGYIANRLTIWFRDAENRYRTCDRSASRSRSTKASLRSLETFRNNPVVQRSLQPPPAPCLSRVADSLLRSVLARDPSEQPRLVSLVISGNSSSRTRRMRGYRVRYNRQPRHPDSVLD